MARRKQLALDDRPDRNESLLIHDIARLQKKHFDRRARALGLTRAQWLTVGTLRRNPGIKQAELADLLDVEPITVVRIVDRLEKAHWIERRADPSDRRAKRLYLTDRSQGVVSELRTLGLKTRNESLAGLTFEDHALLIDLLKRIKSNLSDMNKTRPS